MVFTQILSLTKTYTFIHPTNPGTSFSVTPTAVTLQIPSKAPNTSTVQWRAVPLPSWLCAADANGNPTHIHLQRAVSEGSVKLG